MKKLVLTLGMGLCFSVFTYADNVEDFVSRFYTEVLGRTAETAGLTDWSDKLRNGERDPQDVAVGFVFSDEFQEQPHTDEEFVRILYRAFFNREADTQGLDHWTQKLAQGDSEENVLQGFLGSPEFDGLTQTFGLTSTGGNTSAPTQNTNNIEGFVSRFYTEILNRNPDTDGLAYWTSKLQSGALAGEDIAKGFINSGEFSRRNLSNEQYINVLYRAFFGRDADTDGFGYWVRELQLGKSPEKVLQGFLESQEFINLAQSYGIRATRDSEVTSNGNDNGTNGNNDNGNDNGSNDDNDNGNDNGSNDGNDNGNDNGSNDGNDNGNDNGSNDDNIVLHYQGQNCLNCHNFASAGTVFSTLDANDNTVGATGYRIKLSTGNVFNAAIGKGNSYALSFPTSNYTAEVMDANGNIVNSSAALSHDSSRRACNSCHTATGNNGAPGRILNKRITPTPTTPPTPTTSATSFNTDILPILTAKCKACHGTNGQFTVTTANATYANITALKGSATAGGTYLLQKSSNSVAHGGGQVITTTSTEYTTIQAWVTEGGLNN